MVNWHLSMVRLARQQSRFVLFLPLSLCACEMSHLFLCDDWFVVSVFAFLSCFRICFIICVVLLMTAVVICCYCYFCSSSLLFYFMCLLVPNCSCFFYNHFRIESCNEICIIPYPHPYFLSVLLCLSRCFCLILV